MKLPEITKFLDIKNPKDSLGPGKVEEMDKESLGPKEVYLSWESSTSVQDQKGINKRFIRSFTIIGIFVGLLLLIMQEFFVILIIGSLIFVIQAIMKMSPENVRYEISNHGIMVGDNLYYWDKLRRFFFVVRENSEVIAIDTILGFPGRIFIPFEARDKEKIKEILIRYLHFLELEPKTFFDNAYDRVVRKFSLEEEDAEEIKGPGIEVAEEESKENIEEETAE